MNQKKINYRKWERKLYEQYTLNIDPENVYPEKNRWESLSAVLKKKGFKICT